ncbi:AAA family ATPase [Candidatus Micrarchaeota archaeon]|nr:AAA family ATPase [Candidatus Micrarchaeota archaeon]
MLVFLLGVKAVGKSKLTSELNKHLDGKIHEISYGDIMLEIGKEKKIITDREQIAKLPSKQQNEIRQAAAERIRKLADKEDFVFLNTHGYIYTMPHHTYLPGSPDSVVELLKPNFILLVEADPNSTIARRKMDLEKHGRKREIGSAKEVEEAAFFERIASVHISMKYACDIKVFDNTLAVAENTLEISKLSEMFKSFIK